MSAAKRPASDTFEDDQIEKKQNMDGNHDITVGDGIYEDDANTPVKGLALPFRPPSSAKQS
jgi:hypothetical protein